jgi:hypothetical protein
MTPVSVTAHPATLTVAGMKAHVDAFVAKRLADLSAESAAVTASTRMTTAQKAIVQARITAQVDALTALKSAVDAETTVAAIKADLAAARLPALKTEVSARIDIRLARLQAMLAKVEASATMDATTKADLVTKLQAKVTALTALKSAVAAETTTAGVLADLRKAEAMWLVLEGRTGHHKGDPNTASSRKAVHGAVWMKDGHRVRDPRFSGVFAVRGGHSSSCAGHHGFGGHHSAGARPA